MHSRNSREGRNCGYTAAPDEEGRRHVRSQTGHQVSASAATRTVVARLVLKAEEWRQMALVAHIMDEDRNALRELTRH
jgi:hypothetical protein